MDHPVLVATSTPPFGMLIEQTLEASGRFSVTLVECARQALDIICRERFDLAIIDCDLSDMPLADLAWALREANQNTCIVVVPPENDTASPALAGFKPDGFLTKPFYLPDLLDTIEEIMGQVEASPVASQALFEIEMPAPPVNGEHPPAWLEDVDRAAQYLARLTLESAAQAALIVKNSSLWAYAGELPQPAGLELAQVTAKYWGRDGSSDLARFIRLQSVSGEFMLYATSLGGEMVLTLAFDVETPFSKIRSQASRLARALASPPASEPEAQENQEEEQESFEGELPPIPPLFDDVPPPSPNLAPRPYEPPFLPADPEQPVEGGRRETNHEWIPLYELGSEAHGSDPAFASQPANPGPGMMEAQPELDLLEANDDVLADTHPQHLDEPQLAAAGIAPPLGVDELEPASAAVCSLHFTCLLIPRLPKHHLTGELASGLSDWMHHLSLAFGWRLEYLAIRPNYLQWMVNVPPSTSPSYLMRVIRQHTSQRIFSQFPEFAIDNPSGDYWAPGYLIMSSGQPLPAEVVQDFIEQTRHRQGASRSVPRQR